MNAIARSSLLPFALAVSLSASPVSARPKGKPSDAHRIVLANPEGRAAYERARASFSEGDYDGSLRALEEAQKLAPDPRLFWNMAACERKLGHYAAAMVHVDRYLLSAQAMIGENERREAMQFLEAAEAYVAMVVISTKLDGVEVSIDGESVGTTPFGGAIVVDDGTHKVRFSRSGYRTVERSETVRGGSALTWAIELEPENVAAPLVAEPREQARIDSKAPSRAAPFALTGAGVITALTGGVLVGLTLSQASAIEAECGTQCPPQRWEKYQTIQTVGDVVLVTGGVMILAGLTWLALQPQRDAQAVIRPWRVTF